MSQLLLFLNGGLLRQQQTVNVKQTCISKIFYSRFFFLQGTHQINQSLDHFTIFDLSNHEVQVRWVAPNHGWVCLNFDGATRSSQNMTGCGALLRDHNGNWLVSLYSRALECF